MECNKDEAIKAREIAENKLQKGDYVGAQKIARKAQQLYPDLENISHLLAVCDVHCAAQTTLLGSEMDWYGILQTEQFANELNIKKQYRKLALLLHPDKNRIAGAEAAFKLIGEANRVLTDQTKRIAYDMKLGNSVRTTAAMPPPHQSNGNPFNFPNAPQSNIPNTSRPPFTSSPYDRRAKRPTFWTCCQHCGVRYQYYVNFVNVALRCQRCQRNFIGHNLGFNGAPPIYSWTPFPRPNGIPNQGPFMGTTASNGGKPACTISSKKRTKTSAEESGESSLSNKSQIRNCKGKKEAAAMSECNDKNSDAEVDEKVQYPDPDFNDFEKDRAENCFAINQVWALYDDVDGMPRFYARVKRIISPGFKLQFTWLEANPDNQGERDWCDAKLPIGCGQYSDGDSEETEDRLMFSHQMHCIRSSGGSYVIYPRKGETWALFRNWNIKWSSNPVKHKPPYEFEYVLVFSDFIANAGIEVSYLSKVKGFVGLFRRTGQQAIVPRSELYRFSHRIPSFKMTGKERDSVPVGSFELDPGSLLNCVDGLTDPNDPKMQNARPDNEANNSSSKSWEIKMKPIVLGLTANGTRTPKKHHRDPRKESNGMLGIQSQVGTSEYMNKVGDSKDISHGNLTQPKGSFTKLQADESSNILKKHEKNDLATDALKLRRSPRDSSKKNTF